jgi:hypothetical protein
VVKSASVDGARIAEPAPCTARAASSHAADCATPIASDAAENTAKRKRVGVLHPRQAGGGKPQFIAQLWQRGNDDRDIEHDHQVAAQHDRKHGVAP